MVVVLGVDVSGEMIDMTFAGSALMPVLGVLGDIAVNKLIFLGTGELSLGGLSAAPMRLPATLIPGDGVPILSIAERLAEANIDARIWHCVSDMTESTRVESALRVESAASSFFLDDAAALVAPALGALGGTAIS